MYLGSSVSSTESDISSVNSTIWMHHMDTDEKARQELHKNATSYIEQIQEATSHEITLVQPPTSSL